MYDGCVLILFIILHHYFLPDLVFFWFSAFMQMTGDDEIRLFRSVAYVSWLVNIDVPDNTYVFVFRCSFSEYFLFGLQILSWIPFSAI
jgi:hypothetical protein